jgi:ketosteroid isomerase-like protein
MHTRSAIGALPAAVLALLALLVPAGARAADSPDVTAVRAANEAYYAGLSSRDLAGLRKVWSADADIEHIGPMSKTPDIGFAAFQKDPEGLYAQFPQLHVAMPQPRIKVISDVARVSGLEKVRMKDKAGKEIAMDVLGTSLFAKQRGRWVMVHHHASAVP